MEELWNDFHPPSLQKYNPKKLFQDFPPRSKSHITPISILSKDHDNQYDNLVEKYESLKNIFNSPYEGLANVPNTYSSSCLSVTNKRVFEDDYNNMVDGGGDDHDVDRRHKRMMKNRDSAARSRARKQAYTSQLERECAELKEENARLRKEQQELLESAPAHVPIKSNHTRSLTAPF